MGRTPLLFVLTLIWIAPVDQPQAPRPACTAAAHRQFDFWAGTWDVRTADGNVAGTNTITIEAGGCVLVERWSGATGTTGISLNSYDPGTKQWHQTWVDSSGLRLDLNGSFRDGAMRLEGRGFGAAADAALNRVTWTPRTDGTVRQLWERSTDAGRTWSIVFDGVYRN